EVFANLSAPVKFTGYITPPQALPAPLDEFYGELQQALTELEAAGGDKFSVEIIDPQAGDGAVAVDIAERFGFQPMATSLLSTETFYFYLTLSDGDEVVQVALPENLNTEAVTRTLNDGLKRFASGVLKTVALVAPEAPPPFMQQGAPRGNEYNQLRQFLAADFNVVDADLATGVVPDNADLLMLIEPNGLDETAVFAVDQFLMRGGTVVLATAPYAASLQATSLSVTQRASGLEAWLAHHGLGFEPTLVMDPQNSAFPAPITRQVGGFSFQEMVLLDYPYFVDVRGDGLLETLPLIGGLPQVTLTWPSPIAPAQEQLAESTLTYTPILQSSADAWLSANTDVMPKYDPAGGPVFAVEGETAVRDLAALVSGRFESYFKGQPSPLLAAAAAANAAEDAAAAGPGEVDLPDDAASEDATEPVIASVVERSPESARVFLFASNDFLADQITRLIGSADGTFYTGTAQLMANVVDYSLEDQSLLSIRGRGQFNRTLPPMEAAEQQRLEYLNYALALLGIALVWLWQRRRRAGAQATYAAWLGEGAA
ncbi:MAG: Gldg family protein, partial [Pseudomonadota bacterium]